MAAAVRRDHLNRRRASPTAPSISDACPVKKGLERSVHHQHGHAAHRPDGSRWRRQPDVAAVVAVARRPRGVAPPPRLQGAARARRWVAAKVAAAAVAAAPSPSRGCRSSRGRRRSTTTTRGTSRNTIRKATACLRAVPRMMATPYPAEIIQLPEQKRIIMIFEGATHIWREICMDGRPHPKGDALNPTYLGHSVGRWEGDTLVVDVVGFNEATWLDYFGHPTPTAARRRAVLAAEQGHAALRSAHRRSRRLHEAVHRRVGHSLERERRAHRIHLPGEQQVPAAADRRFRPAGVLEQVVRQITANGKGGSLRPALCFFVLLADRIHSIDPATRPEISSS